MSSSYEHLQLLSLADVKTSGFGVVPVIELREWIDVLHLANKWNYTSIRSAALDAIRPLASCVDTIVLAREYKLNDWLPSALRELVTRSEGLTLAEGHRLGMEVVIMVAEARNNAKGVLSSGRVDDVIDALYYALAIGDHSAMGQGTIKDDLVTEADVLPPRPAMPQVSSYVKDAISYQDQRRLNDWAINALEHKVAGQKRLAKHVEEHPSHVAAVVSAVLNSLWEVTKKRLQSNEMNCRGDSQSYSSSIPSTLALLRTCTSVTVFDAQVRDFCLQKISRWETIGGIIDVPLNAFASALCPLGSYYDKALGLFRLDFNYFGFSNDYIDMITTGRAVRYLQENEVVDQSLFSKAIFASLWDELLRLLRNLWEKQALDVANAIRVTLLLMGRCASTNHACKEIEEFYEEVKEKAKEGDSPAVRCLKVRRGLSSTHLFRLLITLLRHFRVSSKSVIGRMISHSDQTQ
jgi:hypothetical protein